MTLTFCITTVQRMFLSLESLGDELSETGSTQKVLLIQVCKEISTGGFCHRAPADTPACSLYFIYFFKLVVFYGNDSSSKSYRYISFFFINLINY